MIEGSLRFDPQPRGSRVTLSNFSQRPSIGDEKIVVYRSNICGGVGDERENRVEIRESLYSCDILFQMELTIRIYNHFDTFGI